MPSKIDLRGLIKYEDGCPFRCMSSVRCASRHAVDPDHSDQYVCECIEDEPAPQSRGQNK